MAKVQKAKAKKIKEVGEVKAVPKAKKPVTTRGVYTKRGK